MKKSSIFIDLSASKKTSYGKEDFVSQSLPQKVFSAIWDAESEVNNGGFWQYFVNNSAETASFVVEAFETVGARKMAGVCERAIAVAFPGGLPPTPEDISSAAAGFSKEVFEKLEPLNQEFFGCPDDVTRLLFAYVSKHPEEFGTLPKPDDA